MLTPNADAISLMRNFSSKVMEIGFVEGDERTPATQTLRNECEADAVKILARLLGRPPTPAEIIQLNLP